MGDYRSVCPAARGPYEPPGRGLIVVCGVLRQANDDGAQIDGFTHRGYVSPVVSYRDDPHVIEGFCCAEGGLPALGSSDEAARGHAHYTACPVWQGHKDALRERRKGPDRLHDRAHRERSPLADEIGFRDVWSSLG